MGKGRCRPRWMRAILYLLTFGLLIEGLVACNKVNESKTVQLSEGNIFPSSVINFISGKEAVKGSLQGKIIVLNIWATWCPPCRREMPGLDQLSKTLDPDRFAVIGLSTDDDALMYSEFILQNHIGFANVLDLHGNLTRQLGLQGYPETFVIGRNHVLLRRLLGQRDWDSPDMISMLEGLDLTQQGSNEGKSNAPQ